VQHEFLNKNPSADIRVYAVWFNMFPGDARWRWDGGGLTDPRVLHFWDEHKTVGTWFSMNLTDRDEPTWDFYALYEPSTPDLRSPSSMGGTIVDRRDTLQAALTAMLARSAALEGRVGDSA
jgi:hypothetical protein